MQHLPMCPRVERAGPKAVAFVGPSGQKFGMSIPSPDPALEQAISRILESAPIWTENPAGAFGDPAFRVVFAAPVASQAEVVNRLKSGLDAADGYQAARIALAIGTLVESGADPALAGLPTVNRLARALREPVADAARQERTVKFLGLAAMAMLTRDVAVRQAARKISGFAEAIADSEVAEAQFVDRVLGLADDLPVLILHVDRAEAYRIRLDAVATNFHLFTLLADQFPSWCGDDLLSPEVAAIARGEVALTQSVSDHARFHLFDWSGLDRHPGSSLWGEASPVNIPTLDQERVVLVGAKLFGARSWDAGFFANFHDALRSGLRIETTLTLDERQHWLDRIRGRRE